VKSRILPLNLPAQADYHAAGNPVNSRLEDAVGNCCPGLEMDHRNLDRRFLPGLVFEFVWGGGDLVGGKLIAVDRTDPDLPYDPDYGNALAVLEDALTHHNTALFLHTIEQASRKIDLWDRRSNPPAPWNGGVVWRIVRSLEPGKVSITVEDRTGKILTKSLQLTALRRNFVAEDGTLSAVYQPGELTQSLCSPWQHDFRDCSCNYWASNHPDVVYGADPRSENGPSGPGSGDYRSARRLLWMRWQQDQPIAPAEKGALCRPFEMDHYEINQRWQDLPFVLEGHEVHTIYATEPLRMAEPLPDHQALQDKLRELAAMELALAMEYLYAHYTVRLDFSGEKQEHAKFLAHETMIIAASEMMHVRWVNQLRWELWELNPVGPFVPVLQAAGMVPGSQGLREAQQRRLDDAIEDFIAAEVSSGSLDGKYARVFATLERGYPPHMAELASRIIADGVNHFTHCKEIRAILLRYADRTVSDAWRLGKALAPVGLIRDLRPAKLDDPILKDAKARFQEIIKNLKTGYLSGEIADRKYVVAARDAMSKLDQVAQALGEQGIAIPFLELAQQAP
jgi:hypothetical protein